MQNFKSKTKLTEKHLRAVNPNSAVQVETISMTIVLKKLATEVRINYLRGSVWIYCIYSVF